MNASQILDTIERLLSAAGHPDMTGFRRYSGAVTGLEITYASLAHAFIYIEPAKPATQEAHLPEVMPEYKTRVVHLLALLVDLFELARPAGWRWRLVQVDGAHLSPSGIEVNAGGATTLLRVTAGGAPGTDTDPASFAEWQIPAEAVSAAL